jgi:type I restriction enzyme S subunit
MSSDPPIGRFSIGDLIKLKVIAAHKDGNYGSSYPQIDDFVNDGFPLLTAKVVNAGRIDFDAAQKLSKEKAISLPFGFIQADDVLLSHNATVGRIAVVPAFSGRALVGTSLTYFRLDKSKLLPRYLAAFFESRDFQNQLAGVMGLSTRNQVPITAQRLLEVDVPPLHIQRKISEIIGAFDDRITLLRETNATLEAIAQALFKSWFVDFDPVRAKMEGRVPEGMDEATARLFPDSFEESELGLVPRGWRTARLDEFMELAYGKALKATDRIAGEVPVYGSGGVTGFHNEGLVTGPSIIIGRKGTVGSLSWEDQPFYAIDTVFYVRTANPMTYCFYLLQTLGLTGMNTDAAVPGLNRGNVYRLTVPFPGTEILGAFDEIAGTIRERIFSNSQQAQTLATLRDTLLPRLISGQLRLPEVETLFKETQSTI